MEALRTVTLVGATVTLGLIAGVFGLYAIAIMPGLGATDDRTFVRAFQAIDRAIITPLFLTLFFAPLVLAGAGLALHLGGPREPALPWIATAFALYFATVAITLAINVPLNDAIKAAEDLAEDRSIRARFHEAKWIRWNVVRTLACAIAFACLAWALVLHGRSSGVAS
jgi:uncharacterized membrane protein